MLDLIAQRIAALLIGLILGLIIAISLMWWVTDMDQWWILVVVPLACGIVCGLVGDKALEIFKEIAKWTS